MTLKQRWALKPGDMVILHRDRIPRYTNWSTVKINRVTPTSLYIDDPIGTEFEYLIEDGKCFAYTTTVYNGTTYTNQVVDDAEWDDYFNYTIYPNTPEVQAAILELEKKTARSNLFAPLRQYIEKYCPSVTLNPTKTPTEEQVLLIGQILGINITPTVKCYKIVRTLEDQLYSIHASLGRWGRTYIPEEWTTAPANSGLFVFETLQGALDFLTWNNGPQSYQIWECDCKEPLPTPIALPHLINAPEVANFWDSSPEHYDGGMAGVRPVPLGTRLFKMVKLTTPVANSEE